jgi:hypothetical protein
MQINTQKFEAMQINHQLERWIQAKQQEKRLSVLILKFCPAMETFSLIYTKSTRGIMNSEFLTKIHC